MTIQDKPVVVYGLLLAAGASRRLGQPKQLVKYKGNYLINHAIEAMVGSELNDLIVVLGSQFNIINPVIISDVNVLNNKNWEIGMASSISIGVQYLNNNIEGVLVSLVDQYMLTSELIDLLIKKYRINPNKLIASKYGNGVYGPPAIFPNRLFNDLKSLEGDRGAGKIIQNELLNHPEQLIIVDFEKGHLDIDTPEDLLNLSK